MSNDNPFVISSFSCEDSLDTIIKDMRKIHRTPINAWYQVVITLMFGWIFNLRIGSNTIYEADNSAYIGLERRKKPRMIDLIKQQYRYHMLPKTELIQSLESKKCS